jgi:hypothetical protein
MHDTCEKIVVKILNNFDTWNSNFNDSFSIGPIVAKNDKCAHCLIESFLMVIKCKVGEAHDLGGF